MSLLKFAIAGAAGIAGAAIGGLNSFILFGAMAILEIILRHAGVDTTIFKIYGVDLFFTPCVLFNSTCAAAGLGALKGKMKAWDTLMQFGKLKDVSLFLCSMVGGMFGYFLLTGEQLLKLPVDTGALSIVLAAIVYRIIFPRKRLINKTFRFALMEPAWMIREGIICFFVCLLASWIVSVTGEVILPFSLSALSLQLQKKYKLIPTTHHVSITASYAMLATGNLLIAVIAGLVSHVIFTLFSGFFNLECGTHIDGPSVAISICSIPFFL